MVRQTLGGPVEPIDIVKDTGGFLGQLATILQALEGGSPKGVFAVNPDGEDYICSDDANVIEQVYYEAEADVEHILEGVVFAYSAAPTGGYLYIESDDLLMLKLWVTLEGPQPIMFDPGLAFPVGQDLSVSLSAGGAGIKGSLFCAHWKRDIS